MPAGLFPDWMQSIMVLILLLVTIFLVVQQANEMKRLQEGPKRRGKIVTRIDCGGEKKERPFQEGDYVGKQVDCGGEERGWIVAIYSLEEEQKGKKSGKK